MTFFARWSLFALGLAALGGCSSYPYARNLRMVSFDGEARKVASVGAVHGEDCTWSFFNNQVGHDPALDRAMTSVRTQKNYHSFNRGTATSSEKPTTISTVTNLRTEAEDSNFWIFRKTCVIVKAEGYK